MGPSSTSRRIAAAAACFAACVVLAFVIAAYVADETRPGHAGPLTDPTDFVAFYCGASVLAHGHDPYRAEPLRACEDAAFAESRIVMMEHLVVPAPLPPYALAFFEPFAWFSFRFACVAFFFASIAVTGAAVAAAHRLSKIPLAFVCAAIVVALGVGSIYIGQLVPVVVSALAAGALAARAGKMWLAAACVAVAMIEPNIGLAALVALFALERRARVAVAAMCALLAAISLGAGGVALDVEYATRVLPAHALSEVANFHAQYSLTAVAYALGASPELAVRVGEASYAAMLAAGIWLAARLRRTYGDGAFVVLAPPACVLAGGVYLHDHQMAVALPFAVTLARYARGRVAILTATATVAIPWQSVFELFLVPFFPSHVRFDPDSALALVSNGSLLAETSWRVWIDSLGGRDGRTPFEMLLFKLPTWLALAALAYYAVRPALRSAIRR